MATRAPASDAPHLRQDLAIARLPVPHWSQMSSPGSGSSNEGDRRRSLVLLPAGSPRSRERSAALCSGATTGSDSTDAGPSGGSAATVGRAGAVTVRGGRGGRLLLLVDRLAIAPEELAARLKNCASSLFSCPQLVHTFMR